MPQLDKLTFISQVFWLVLTFLSLYIVAVRHLLPSIVNTLKTRNKKLQEYKDQVATLRTEESATIASYENILTGSFDESNSLLQKNTAEMTKWFQDSVKNTNKTYLLDANKKFIDSIGEITAQRILIENIVQNVAKNQMK